MGQICTINDKSHVNLATNKREYWKPNQVLSKGNFNNNIFKKTSTVKVIDIIVSETDIYYIKKIILNETLLNTASMDISSKNSIMVSKKSANLNHNLLKEKETAIFNNVMETKQMMDRRIEYISNSAKEFIKFNQTASQVVSFLNNEASSTLRDTMGNMDNIRLQFYSILKEIVTNEENYNKYLQNPKLSLPTVQGLQTSTKNEVDITDDEEPLCELEEVEEINENSVLPQIITVVHTGEKPTAQIQQAKKDRFNIPLQRFPLGNHQYSNSQLPLTNSKAKKTLPYTNSKEPITLHQLSQSVIKRQIESTLRNKTKSLTLALQTAAKQDISTQLRHRIREIVAKLALATPKNRKVSGVRMSRALPNLHTQLIKEVKSSKNAIEFKRATELSKSCTDKKDEIFAEELFIPERQINRIASTLSNKKESISKGCQFLYREKRKKRDLMLNADNTIPEEKKILPVQHKCKAQQISKSNLKIKKSVVETISKSKSKIKSKYSNSLFFTTNKTSHDKLIATIQPRERSIKKNYTCNSTSSIDHKEESVHSSTTLVQTVDVQTSTPSTFKATLNCFDILDEITLMDLQPFKSEYPRKDTIGAPPFCPAVEETFLYKLVYNTHDSRFAQLLETATPEVQCSSNNCHTCAKLKKSKKLNPHSSSDANKLKSRSNLNTTEKEKRLVAAKLRPYIFDPCTQYPTKSIIVMPVTVTYQNQNFNRHQHAATNKQGRSQKFPKAATCDLITFLHKQNEQKHAYERSPSPTVRIGAWGEPMQITPRTNAYPKKIKQCQVPTVRTAEAITSCKLLLDVKKTTLEKNIQNVIEMIETKIVDTLSNPQKQTSQTFSAIEGEIVQILDTMRNKPARLGLIEEVTDGTAVSHTNQEKPEAKSAKNTILNGKEDPVKTTSSCEERFEVTSSCEPKQHHFDIEVEDTINKLEQTACELETQLKKSPTQNIQMPRRIISRLSESKEIQHTEKDLISKNDSVIQNPEVLKNTTNVQNKIKPMLGKHTATNSQETLEKDLPNNFQSEQSLENTTETYVTEPIEVNSLKQLEKPTEPSETKPDSFLTPFMHAIKQHRNDDHNYQSNSAKNILEFLDALSNISEDLPAKPSKAFIQVHCRTTLHSACILYNAETYNPIKIEYPIIVKICKRICKNTNKDKKVSMLFKSKSFTSFNQNVCTGLGHLVPKLELQKKKNSRCTLEQITTRKVQSSFEINESKQEEYGSFLNSLYSLVFTTMFFGLTFNYACN